MRLQNNRNLSAIVLAGGQSSRMGQDKALVSIGQRTLLQQVCQVAQQCTSWVYVVTPWVDRYEPLLHEDRHATFNEDNEDNKEADLSRSQIHLVREHALSADDIMHGPLVGFAQGLAQIETEWVLLLACDLPNLQVEVLQQWATLLPHASEDTIALLSKNSNGWWEALCGFYRRCSLEKLEPFIQQGGRSFQRWLAQESVQELPLADVQMLFNCNTPADVEAVRNASLN